MNTEILKLDPPYEYIYCNGSIGLHIATMIVYEAKTDEDGKYQFVTHSHPIVKYHKCPGGTVWNRAELTDCKVLCREDDKRITMNQLYDFVSGVGQMRLSDDYVDVFMDFLSAAAWKDVLDTNGIDIEWPMLDVNGEQKPQDEFIITLMFQENPEGSRFKYMCRDYGASDIELIGGALLPFSSQFNTKEDLEIQLMNGMMSYYTAFRDHQFKIVFDSHGSEFDDIIAKVNSKEEEYRKSCNEIDV